MNKLVVLALASLQVTAGAAAADIAGSKDHPMGVGMAAPVASNDNEAGRAKNRRVELVKR